MNKKKDALSTEAMDFLVKYTWPGNVRELENAIERAVVVSKTNILDVQDLPFQVSANNHFDKDDKSLAAMEKRHISLVLNELNWNISRTADALKIDRVTLYNKINKYGLQRKA